MGKIAEFTEQYQKLNTRKIYATGIKAYLAFFYDIDRKNNTPIEVYESAADRYLSEGRD